jgi:hypothetical protein
LRRQSPIYKGTQLTVNMRISALKDASEKFHSSRPFLKNTDWLRARITECTKKMDCWAGNTLGVETVDNAERVTADQKVNREEAKEDEQKLKEAY